MIQIDGIGKRYKLGNTIRHDTLRDLIMHRLTGKEVQAPVEDVDYFWALRDVSFNVAEGEVVGIIGKNGAGKSTLLKILSRITPPTAGTITLNGRVASLLEVGTGFHAELSGRENIFLNGAILGMSRQEIKAKFDEIITFAGVEKFLDTPVKRYSSGMYVRLAFAVAAHLEPEILIVDEVLAVGDLEFQKKCLGKMSEVARGGRTVLFVSHNMAAIRGLCSRVALLANGRLKNIGDTEEMIAEYIQVMRPEGGGEVTFDGLTGSSADIVPRRLTTCRRDGQQVTQFKIGEPWLIELQFEVQKPLASVIASIGVQTADGISVASFWTRAADLEVGIYRAEFIVDFRFRSREFLIGVGLSSYSQSLFYREGVASVNVLEVSDGEQPFRATGPALMATGQDATIEAIAEVV